VNIKDTVCPFAVKGGGHHTVIGISNIDNGLTIDLGNMNQTTWNNDKSIGYVGAGARWGAVYEALGRVNRGAAGGRVADIGVGGYTTGGKLRHAVPIPLSSVNGRNRWYLLLWRRLRLWL